MKRSLFIFVLVLVAAMGQAQIPIPLGIKATPSSDGTSILVTWGVPIIVSGKLHHFDIDKIESYTDDKGIVHTDTSSCDSHGSPDKNNYVDRAVSPCYLYTYLVRTVVQLDKDVLEESSPSSASTQIKGGVNAVVIFPTPIDAAVAGSPFTFQVQACDLNADAALTYQLTRKPDGMTIDKTTGVVSWFVTQDWNMHDTNFEVYVRDNEGHSATREFALRIRPQGASSTRITGHVIIPKADPPLQVALTLFNASNTGMGMRTSPDGDGNYAFENVAPDLYILAYEVQQPPAPPSMLRWYVNASTTDSASIIRVSPTDTLVELQDITIGPPPSKRKKIYISGRIRSTKGNLPPTTVAPYNVSDFIHPPQGPHSNPSHPQIIPGSSTQVASDGTFSVAVDSGNTYLLLTSAVGYQSRFLGDGQGCSSPYCAQTVTANSDTSITDGVIAPNDTSGQQISGSVTSIASGKGVAAMMLLTRTDKGTITSGYSGGLVPFDAVTADSAGNFSFTSIPRDTAGLIKYMLQAVPFSGFVPSFYSDNDSVQNLMLWENAKLFSVDTAKRDPLSLKIHVQPVSSGTGTISGTVREDFNEGAVPSQNAYVYAVDLSTMTAEGFAVTNSGDGSFAINNLPAGKYALFADKISFYYADEEPIYINPTDSTSNSGHDLLLTHSSSLAVVQNTVQPVDEALSPAYPNPFSETAMVRVKAESGSSLKMYDMFGRECADFSAQAHAGSMVFVPGERFAAGTYFLILRDTHGSTERPLIITH